MEKNLYTNGGEYILNGEEYVGYYSISIDGTAATGQTLNEESQPLTIMPEALKQYKIASSTKINDAPVPFVPIPTEEDYKRSWFLRYFVQRANDLNAEIVEIDEKQYNAIFGQSSVINYQLYIPMNLRWKIAGPLHDEIDDFTRRVVVPGVEDTNRRTVQASEKKMPGLSTKLVKLDQFYSDDDSFSEIYSKEQQQSVPPPPVTITPPVEPIIPIVDEEIALDS